MKHMRLRLDPLMREWLESFSRSADGDISEFARLALELHEALQARTDLEASHDAHRYVVVVDRLRLLASRRTRRQLPDDLDKLWCDRLLALKHVLETEPAIDPS